MSAQVDRIRNDLEAAKATHSAGLDSLTNNGKSLYAPDEEARRRQELTATYRTAQRAAQDALQAAITGAEKNIVEAGVRDPLTRLQPTELERASHLRGFVADDYERLPIGTLAEMARESLQGGDKATIAVHLRAGHHALAGRFSSPGQGHELRQALAELEEVFTDRAKRDAATATIDAAQRLQVNMATSNYIERTYGTQRPIRVA